MSAVTAGVPRAGGRRLPFRLLVGGLAASAWLVLWLWSESPYGRFVDHGRWNEVGILASLCSAVPDGERVVPAVLYAAGWILMIAAMMLPTTLPILEIFRRMTAGRRDGASLVAAVVAGYFCAWFGFGLAAHAADAALHAQASQSAWLMAHGWVAGVAVLTAAGLFQFSALKYRCLEKCHTPLGFILERWQGRAPAREALRLGLDHGLFCVGCCWALMLLMFVVGTGNVGWMLALAAVMAAEKNLPRGRALRAPLGAGLLAWAGAILVGNL